MSFHCAHKREQLVLQLNREGKNLTGHAEIPIMGDRVRFLFVNH